MVGHDRTGIVTDKQANVVFDVDSRLETLSSILAWMAAVSSLKGNGHVAISLISIHLMSVGSIQLV
jgi:hypothetical protein